MNLSFERRDVETARLVVVRFDLPEGVATATATPTDVAVTLAALSARVAPWSWHPAGGAAVEIAEPAELRGQHGGFLFHVSLRTPVGTAEVSVAHEDLILALTDRRPARADKATWTPDPDAAHVVARDAEAKVAAAIAAKHGWSADDILKGLWGHHLDYRPLVEAGIFTPTGFCTALGSEVHRVLRYDRDLERGAHP